ncbi:GDP-mannose 4,6-dehydratase [Candidatus Kaiserbacteria bacterium]|nr:GDP-mannose 4,6-dehydratase [Candidatus Kaiserbacteria bacterium]
MSSNKTAIVTGISGQDGSYLSELLRNKKYHLIGVTIQDVPAPTEGVEYERGDISDRSFVEHLIARYKPDEIYNMASIATVAKPWEDPIAVAQVAGMAPLYFLESIRQFSPQTRFFQASSAEMYGSVTESPQSEQTRFAPVNPYGAAKLFAHNMTEMYRNSHGTFAVSGILFNHESPRRPLGFVTRKITHTLAAIAQSGSGVLQLGNLDAERDWSYAGDIVEGMWMSLQHDAPGTYVFASGEVHTVREFVQVAARCLGMDLHWQGEDVDEKALDAQGRVVVEVNPDFYRPVETHVRRGDISHAKEILDWKPQTSFHDLVEMMVRADKVTT